MSVFPIYSTSGKDRNRVTNVMIFGDSDSAKDAAMWERSKGKNARVYMRDVRAHGVRAEVWIVVVLRKEGRVS